MSPLSGISVKNKWVLGATALGVLPLVAVALFTAGHASPTSTGHSAADGSSPTSAPTPSLSGARSLTSPQQTGLQQSLARMRAQTPVAPATSARYPAVSSQARQQPDLYAAAFTDRLLSQDYRTGRVEVRLQAGLRAHRGIQGRRRRGDRGLGAHPRQAQLQTGLLSSC